MYNVFERIFTLRHPHTQPCANSQIKNCHRVPSRHSNPASQSVVYFFVLSWGIDSSAAVASVAVADSYFWYQTPHYNYSKNFRAVASCVAVAAADSAEKPSTSPLKKTKLYVATVAKQSHATPWQAVRSVRFKNLKPLCVSMV